MDIDVGNRGLIQLCQLFLAQPDSFIQEFGFYPYSPILSGIDQESWVRLNYLFFHNPSFFITIFSRIGILLYLIKLVAVHSSRAGRGIVLLA